MKKKLYTMLTVLLIVMVAATPVLARGNIKLSGSTFELGSLVAKGFASGLGSTDWVLVLDGIGHAGVICTNNGENDVPGQSFPHVVGRGVNIVYGNDPLKKNGKAPYEVTAKSSYEASQFLSWEDGGCPNSNWTASIDFVYWDFATINAYDPSDTSFSTPVATYEFQCVTTWTGPNSTSSTFDDGTVSCVQTYPAK